MGFGLNLGVSSSKESIRIPGSMGFRASGFRGLDSHSVQDSQGSITLQMNHENLGGRKRGSVAADAAHRGPDPA